MRATRTYDEEARNSLLRSAEDMYLADGVGCVLFLDADNRSMIACNGDEYTRDAILTCARKPT